MAIIEFKNISVEFVQDKRTNIAVKNVNLRIEKGDIYSIVGFSGAGKSTLVRTINLLQRPTGGEIKVNNVVFAKDGKQVIPAKELRKKRRKIGMIFQHFNLLDEATIFDNIAFALKHAKMSDQEIEAKVKKLLELVDLKNKANFYPAQLSGGQKQRVAIARALANDPDILISDEATSALDPQNTIQILDLLKKLNQKMGLTVVLITHEMDAVKRISNKIAIMKDGQIIEQGLLRQVYLHPKHDLTRKFIGGAQETIHTLNKLHLDKLNTDESIYQLVYSLSNVTQSIIIELYEQIGIQVSMLYGNVEVLNDEPIGTLTVLLKANSQIKKAALEFLHKRGVITIQLNERGEVI